MSATNSFSDVGGRVSKRRKAERDARRYGACDTLTRQNVDIVSASWLDSPKYNKINFQWHDSNVPCAVAVLGISSNGRGAVEMEVVAVEEGGVKGAGNISNLS